MAFPVTPTLDDGARGAENPISNSGLWAAGTIVSGDYGMLLDASHLITSTGNGEGCARTTASYGPDCEVWGVIYDSTGQYDLDLYWRILNPGGASLTGYRARFQSDSNTVVVSRYDAGVKTDLQTVSGTVDLNVVVGVRAVGNNFQVYAGGSLLGIVIDATYGLAGKLGAGSAWTGEAWTSFGGGTFVGSASPSLSPSPSASQSPSPSSSASPSASASASPSRSASPSSSPSPSPSSSASPSSSVSSSPSPSAPAPPLPACVIPPEVATLPTPPSSYSLPGSYTAVATSADLIAALESGVATDIVVEDGTYVTVAGEVNCGAGHRVYARNLLGAEIQFGIASNRAGHVFQGLAFHVTDATKTNGGYVLHLWGGGTSQILDCTFLGDDTITAGLGVRATASFEGLVVRRCEARNYHDFGFYIAALAPAFVPTTPPIISDIYAENCVWQSAPGDSNGQSEAGLWLGCKATVDRCWFHQDVGYTTFNATRGWYCAWQGLWIGEGIRDCTISDVYVTGQIAYGIYGYGPINGDDASTVTIQRLETRLPVKIGHHQEWDNPNASHHPNTQNVIVQDSLLETHCVGVSYDTGTINSTVRRTTFREQAGAAICNHNEGVPGNLYDTTGNDYSGMHDEAVEVSTAWGESIYCWNHQQVFFPPWAPVLDAPADSGTVETATPTFTFTGYDPNEEDLTYEIQVSDTPF